MGISINCKDVDRALTYIDTLLNEDIQRLMSWGIRDEDYYINDEGRYLLTADQKRNWDNSDWRTSNAGTPLGSQFPKIQGMFSDGNAHAYGNQPEVILENPNPYDTEFYSHYPFTKKNGFLRAVERADYFPIWEYNFRDGTDEKIAFQEIQDTERIYLPEVIMADDFESAWAEYAARYDKINYQAYVDAVNAKIATKMGITR